MENLTTLITDVVGIVNSGIQVLTSSPLSYYLGGGLLAMGLGLFRKGKKAAR